MNIYLESLFNQVSSTDIKGLFRKGDREQQYKYSGKINIQACLHEKRFYADEVDCNHFITAFK